MRGSARSLWLSESGTQVARRDSRDASPATGACVVAPRASKRFHKREASLAERTLAVARRDSKRFDKREASLAERTFAVDSNHFGLIDMHEAAPAGGTRDVAQRDTKQLEESLSAEFYELKAPVTERPHDRA